MIFYNVNASRLTGQPPFVTSGGRSHSQAAVSAPPLEQQLASLRELVEVLDAKVTARIDTANQKLDTLLDARIGKPWYTTLEFAEQVGRTEFTVREWCRHDRINAEKRLSGRGAHKAWAISHDELLRYQKEGLLPLKRTTKIK